MRRFRSRYKRGVYPGIKSTTQDRQKARRDNGAARQRASGPRQGRRRATTSGARGLPAKPPRGASPRGRRAARRRPAAHPGPPPGGGRAARRRGHHLVHVARAGPGRPRLGLGARGDRRRAGADPGRARPPDAARPWRGGRAGAGPEGDRRSDDPAAGREPGPEPGLPHRPPLRLPRLERGPLARSSATRPRCRTAAATCSGGSSWTPPAGSCTRTGRRALAGSWPASASEAARHVGDPGLRRPDHGAAGGQPRVPQSGGTCTRSRPAASGRKVVRHPTAGKLVFEHAVFRPQESLEQRLVLYTPVPRRTRRRSSPSSSPKTRDEAEAS